MCGINAHHERTVAKLGQFQTRGCSETGFTYAAFSAEQQNPHTNIVLQTRIQLLGYSGVARSEFARQEWTPRTRTDAYAHFKVIRGGRTYHGTVSSHLGRSDTVIFELSFVGFLSPFARTSDTYL